MKRLILLSLLAACAGERTTEPSPVSRLAPSLAQSALTGGCAMVTPVANVGQGDVTITQAQISQSACALAANTLYQPGWTFLEWRGSHLLFYPGHTAQMNPSALLQVSTPTTVYAVFVRSQPQLPPFTVSLTTARDAAGDPYVTLATVGASTCLTSATPRKRGWPSSLLNFSKPAALGGLNEVTVFDARCTAPDGRTLGQSVTVAP